MNSTPDQPAPAPDPQGPPSGAEPAPPLPPAPGPASPPPGAYPPPPGSFPPPAGGPGSATAPPQPPSGYPPQQPPSGYQPAYGQPPAYGYVRPTPPPRLFGWPFGAWIGIGLGLGILIPVAVFFLANAVEQAVNGYSTGAAITYALIAFAVVAIAGIVCMFWAQTRGLGTGLLISIAAAPIVIFGVCVAIISGFGAGGL
ncbi:hypothetical protein [Microbacterium stercoris]|uniref:Uncharacterized protein n=1 Tax=Microbacterium stercoris TaxID=2820289 RepID=A0A939QI84_9MICO|nr:hypothetical protein [Microbacterium stercoris]MBO3663397.1 hypothetical protein [Microbacterium stercoris]